MDKFADPSRRIAHDPAWHLDEDTAVYLREDIDRALRDIWNAALEEARSSVIKMFNDTANWDAPMGGLVKQICNDCAQTISNLKVPKP